jgi:DNA-binding response OmpR family regulator
VVAVAITRLAKHGASISPFVRYVKKYFSLFIRFQRRLSRVAGRYPSPVTLRTLGRKALFGRVRSRAILKKFLGALKMSKIGILIIEDDESSQTALRQILDSEGWQVRIVPLLSQALAELSSGEWSLVILNVAMTGLSGPVYLTLKELALAPAMEEGKVRARVLFLVPEASAIESQTVLEKDRLPYVLKPFQFHDLLEKVSDLLMETEALDSPIRRVRHDASAAERKRDESRAGHESSSRENRRDTGMFANRREYVMTEEEIAEYERSELESQEQKKKKLRQDHY